MNDELINLVRIGWWFADCCAHGLFQIDNEHDLFYVYQNILIPRPPFVGVWETKEEALLDLEKRGLGIITTAGSHRHSFARPRP